MAWYDVYRYENEADQYIRRQEELRKKQEQREAQKLGYPMAKNAKEAFGYTSPEEKSKAYEYDPEKFNTESMYTYNKMAFPELKNLAEPDFKKIEKIKTEKPKPIIGYQLAMMKAKPLAKPFKVYKFKTIDQETGAEVITGQKEIEVIAENEYNFYYLTKYGLQTVNKLEVSKSKFTEKELKEKYMRMFNKQAQNLAKHKTKKLEAQSFGEYEPGFFESTKELAQKVASRFDVATKTLLAETKGFTGVFTGPFEKLLDKAIEGEYAHVQDEKYYEPIKFKLEDGEIPIEAKRAIDERSKMEEEAPKGKYPAGFSEETDAIARGASKEEIAMAREIDKERELKTWIGKGEHEKLTKLEEIANIKGEISGVITDLVAGSKALSGIKIAKWAKRILDAVVLGSNLGIKQKLKERDAEAIDYIRSAAKEAAFLYFGSLAGEKVRSALGQAKSIRGVIGKEALGSLAFSSAGTLASYPLREEYEKTPKGIAAELSTGLLFDIGTGLGGRYAKSIGKIPKKEIERLTKEEIETLAQKGIKNFRTKFKLDINIKNISSKAKKTLANKTTRKLLDEIGDRIITKTGSKEPKKIVEYYKAKYNLKGDIEIDSTLRGNSNFARIEIRDGKIEVRYNKDKSEKEIAGSLRHEIEHILDETSGYMSKETKRIKRPNTLLEYMEKPGHHGKYKNFEIEYLENIYKDEFKAINLREEELVKTLSKNGLKKQTRSKLEEELIQIREDQPTRRMALEDIPEGSNLENERIQRNNRKITEASNLPVYVPPKKTIKQKTKDFFERVYTDYVNRQHGIDKIGQKIKMTSQNYSKYHGTVEYITMHNLVDKYGNPVGNNSIKKVLKAPKGLQAEYESYLYHKHHLSRLGVNKPIIADSSGKAIDKERTKEIIAEYERLYPEFKKYSEELTQLFDDFMRSWAVDGDLLTMEQYKQWKKMYPDFVPAWRDIETFMSLDAPRMVATNRPFKKAKGGFETLVSLTESVPAYFQKVVRAQRRNVVHNQILDTILLNPKGMQKYAEIYSSKKQIPEIEEKLRQFTKTDFEIENTLNILDNLLIESQTKGRFMIALNKGKPITVKINDKNTWEALVNMQKSNISDSNKLLELVNTAFSKPFKGLVTVYNPLFALRNLPRDIPTGIVNTKGNAIKYTKNIFTGLADMIGKNKMWKQFQALGVSHSQITKVEQTLKQRGNIGKTFDGLAKILNWAGNISEALPRYAEFKTIYNKGIKQGKPIEEVITEAVYNAGDITINFARGGKTVKQVDKLYPYINAGVQGMDKWVRSLITEGVAKGNFKPLFRSLGIVTVPSLASIYLIKTWAGKGEGYDNLPDYTKDQNYMIPLSDNNYLKIPKNRETGFFFSTLFERMYRHFVEKDPKAFDNLGEAFKRNITNPIADVVDGSILQPIENLRAGGNKDYFGNDIEPLSARLNKRSKRYITKEDTSKASKFLAPVLEKIGLSPAQSDYLIKSYSGVVGDVILAINDKEESWKDKFLKATHFFYKDTGGKETSLLYETKDKAATELNDFEIQHGIDTKKKELRAEELTQGQINMELENMLSSGEWEEYQKLKEKKREADKLGGE